jgi:hypothetical protein
MKQNLQTILRRLCGRHNEHPRRGTRLYVSVIIAFFLWTAGSIGAPAQTLHNINTDGSITISVSGTYTIEGTGSATTNTIQIGSGVMADITLNNVNINVSTAINGCAFGMTGATVNLTLLGNNVLRSGANMAGLLANPGSKLVITESSTGSLEAHGGAGGAGIGGSYGNNGSDITINGGTIKAYGNHTSNGAGAGIGSGGGANSGGTITINGGTIYAYSSSNNDSGNAGIGGSKNGTILINGGTVTASCSNGGGAGIGTSYSGGSGGSITINGGTVTATGHGGGAGIGGGCPRIYPQYASNGSDVTINGGTVTANGGSGGAAIGGGNGGGKIQTGTLTINGGSVKMNNHNGTPPKNSASKSVYLNILTIGGTAVGNDVSVTAGSIGNAACNKIPDASTGVYGINDVKIRDAGKVYFYLPPTTSGDEWVTLTANGREYGKSYTRSNNHSNNIPALVLACNITLSKTGTHTFSPASYGYDMPSGLDVTVTNAGYNATGALDIALSGGAADKFTLSTPSTISSIAVGGTGSFTVTPNTDIAVGTYTETVTVSGGNGIKASFDVKFMVNKKDISIIGGTIDSKTYNGTTAATVTALIFDGLVSPETLSATEDYTVNGADFDSKDAGVDKPVTVSVTLSTDAASPARNYNLTNGNNFGLLTGNITQKAITVTDVTIAPKTYDGTTAATVSTIAFSGLENGESLTFDTDYTATGTVFTDPNVGSGKTVKATITLAGTAKADNYVISSSMPYELTGQTVAKATPAEAHLQYDLTGVFYDGSPHGITQPALKLPYTGIGNITVKYNGSPTLPTATGAYTVTADVDDTGLNFTAASDIPLGTFTISPSAPQASHLDCDLTPVTYDAMPHAVTVTPKAAYAADLGAVTVKYEGASGTTYPLSASAPVNAGTYSVTADLTAGAGFTAATGLALGTFIINKAVPAPADLIPDSAMNVDTVLYTYYTGEPQGVAMPSLKPPYTGLGEITLKYNGSARLPVYPGTYIVTLDIAEGANYAAITDLPLGSIVITEPASPWLPRQVTLNVSPHFASNPAPGVLSIESGRNLVITLTPLPTLPAGYEPKVTTNRRNVPDDKGGVKVTHNNNGTYTVRIVYISEETEVTIEAVAPSSATANGDIPDAARAWSYGQHLYIAAGATIGNAYIYNITGVLVKILPYAAGETVGTVLPAGVYVVVTEGRRSKVIID